MSKNTLLFIPILLAMMLSYWFVVSEVKQRKAVLMGQLQDTSAATQPALPRVTEADRVIAATPSTREPANVSQELANMQQQLVEELQKLEDQRRTLESLRRQQQAGANPPNYGLRIQQAQAEIQNLTDIINTYIQSENNLQGRVRQSVQEQDMVAKYQRDQVEAAIQNLQQEMQETQRQVTYWRNYPGFDWDQQQRELPRLEALLIEQKTQMESLRTQRVNISETMMNNVQSVFSVADRAREELRDSAYSAEDQITSLRAEILNMQTAQAQGQEQQRILSARISQTEKFVSDQTKVIQNLQDQMRAKETQVQ